LRAFASVQCFLFLVLSLSLFKKKNITGETTTYYSASAWVTFVYMEKGRKNDFNEKKKTWIQKTKETNLTL
jgi:hypothetical protein